MTATFCRKGDRLLNNEMNRHERCEDAEYRRKEKDAEKEIRRDIHGDGHLR